MYKMRSHLERASRRPFYGRAFPLFMIHEREERALAPPRAKLPILWRRRRRFHIRWNYKYDGYIDGFPCHWWRCGAEPNKSPAPFAPAKQIALFRICILLCRNDLDYCSHPVGSTVFASDLRELHPVCITHAAEHKIIRFEYARLLSVRRRRAAAHVRACHVNA